MDINKVFAVALSGWSLGAYASATDLSEGFVRGDGAGRLSLYVTRKVAPTERIEIQFPDKNGNTRCCVQATLEREKPLGASEFVSDEYNDREIVAYRIRAPAFDRRAAPFIGMAVVGNGLQLKERGPDLVLIDGTSQSIMRTCLSYEGVRLTRVSGTRLLAHMYMGLGYDVEPTCKGSLLR